MAASSLLATLALRYPGRIAQVELHCASGYPLYRASAYNRAMWYGAQYYSDTYMDGTYAGSSSNSGNWENLLVARMNRPSPMTATTWGSFNPAARTGRIYAKFRNDSTASISANIYFAVIRDSVRYSSPNGDQWHNYVLHAYLPNETGSPVTVAAGDSVIQYRDFSIPDSFNVNKCMLYSWLQNTSNRNTYQSGIKNVTSLTEVAEQSELALNQTKVRVTPNPCASVTTFLVQLRTGSRYAIRIFDASGREVRSLTGLAEGRDVKITWNCRDDQGRSVNPGVYFYTLSSDKVEASGKIIVR